MLVFVDKMVMDEKPRRTGDGYLVASPRVSRTGIQDYAGIEVGRPDMETVRVYRPEEEVFSPEAMHSMAHRPVTVDHPPVLVDATNWKKYSRGQTGGEVARDGEFIRVPMSLMDIDAINAVMAGKAELSMGYTADMDWTPGVSPQGEAYDAVQRNIRGNHLAIVDAARGGPMLRVIDTKPEGNPMRKVIIDGITVEMSETAAEAFAKYRKDAEEEEKSLADKIKDMEGRIEKMKADMAEMAAEKEKVDAENETIKKEMEDSKLTPAKLDAAVKARSEVIDAARKINPNLVVDGKGEADIRREVVAHKMGDRAKDWSDEAITASFNTLATMRGSSAPASGAPAKTVTADAAYDAMKQRLATAYQNKH